MALLINPANGSTHYHNAPSANVFQWSNTNPVVPTGMYWRLKIGSTRYGYNYYNGALHPVPFTQLYDNVSLTLPNGTKCYATVEWTTDGTNWSNGGAYTFFYCRP